MALRKVNSGTSLHYYEEREGKTHLIREVDGNADEEFFLWMVLFRDGEIKFTLARDERMARIMANSGTNNTVRVDEAIAKQIPFRIQGWGDNEF